MRKFKLHRLKKLSILQSILSLFILLFLFITGCEKNEMDKTPPPDFYEFGITSGDSFVSFAYNFLGLENEKYGVEISYYLDGIKKVQQEFGAFSITINGLTNNEAYTFTIVTYDESGNRSDPFEVKATPNTPFILLSPTKFDDYTIEDGKIRIDLVFNRAADINWPSLPMYILTELNTDSSTVLYDFSWSEDGQVLTLLTSETIDNLCDNLPCNLFLEIRFDWVGNKAYDGFRDTNGMLLDGDKDGYEMGDVNLTFVLKQ